MRWECECGSSAEGRVAWCPTCGRFGSYYPQVNRPVRPRQQGVVRMTAARLASRAQSNVRPTGLWSVLFPEGVQAPCMIVLYGLPGSGKTTLALQLADAWPDASIVFPFEQGMGPALSQLVRRLEVTHPEFVSVDTWSDVIDAMADADLVVVDSLQRSSTDPGDWRAATVDMGKTLVLVSEVNASGEVRGGLAASHLADVSIELPEYGGFQVRKNRFGQCKEGKIDGMHLLRQ